MLHHTDNPAHEMKSSPRQAREGTRALLAVPWTVRQTLIGTVLTVLPLVALLTATQLLTPPNLPVKPIPTDVDRLNAFVSGIASTLVECVFLLAPLYFALRAFATGGADAAEAVSYPAERPAAAGLRALGLRGFHAARAAGGVIAGFVAIYLFGTLYDLLRIPTNVDALLREAVRAPLTTLAALLVAVAVAPVCEEIFFRGFLLPGLARTMPIWAAVLLSALVFGFAHADPGSFVPLVAIGVVLGALRVWTGSVWPGMALHALNNLTAAIYVLSVLHH